MCPECGSMATIRKDKGYANSGDIPVWVFRCTNCNENFTAMLISMPKTFTSLHALDEEYREERKRLLRMARLRSRIRAGQPVQIRPRRRAAGNVRLSSDTLSVTVKINRGEIASPTNPSEENRTAFTTNLEHPMDDPLWHSTCVWCDSEEIYGRSLCRTCYYSLQRHRSQR